MSRRLRDEAGAHPHQHQSGTLAAQTPKPHRGQDKTKESGHKSKLPRMSGKDHPGDILYYAKKLSGPGSQKEMEVGEGAVTAPSGEAGSGGGGEEEMEHSEQDMAPLSEEDGEGEPQPSLSQILRAVYTCTASVNTVKDRLGGLTEEVALLRQDLQKIRERTTAAESRISEIEDQLPPLIADTRVVTRIAQENRDKTDDIENRLRRNNVRIVGLPEKEEGKDPTEFIENWLLETFGKESFTPLFAVERAHRVPARVIPGNAPRPILARMLHYRDREKILRLARERANIRYNGVRVSFYPDFSAEVQKQRTKFYDVKQRLRRLGLPYAMLYPARLRVTAQGRATFFNTAKEAAEWLDVHEPALRNRPREEDDR